MRAAHYRFHAQYTAARTRAKVRFNRATSQAELFVAPPQPLVRTHEHRRGFEQSNTFLFSLHTVMAIVSWDV